MHGKLLKPLVGCLVIQNLLAISLGVQTKCLPSAKVYAPRMYVPFGRKRVLLFWRSYFGGAVLIQKIPIPQKEKARS